MGALDINWPSLVVSLGAILGTYLVYRTTKRSGDQQAEGMFREQLWTANQAFQVKVSSLEETVARLREENAHDQATASAHSAEQDRKFAKLERDFRALTANYSRVQLQLQWAIAWGQTADRPEGMPRAIPSFLLGPGTSDMRGAEDLE